MLLIPKEEITIDVPRIFNPSIIKSNNCNDTEFKEFIINGNFSSIVNNIIDFTMEGTIQIKYNLNCSLYNNAEGETEIHCVKNHKINPAQFFLEEQEIIKGLNKDKFTITDIGLTNIKCINKTIPHGDEDGNNESNFKAFKGKGVTVGSDENITRDNVDYSNLASRNNEDLNSTDSRLDLNTTSSPV